MLQPLLAALGKYMTELTRAIVAHDHKAIENVVSTNSELIWQRENGWLPIEWAEKTGNVVTFARAARIMGCDINRVDAIKYLKNYLAMTTSTEYEPIAADAAVKMVWSSLFSGAEYKVDRWKRPLIATEAHADDLRFLIATAGIECAEQLRGLVENA